MDISAARRIYDAIHLHNVDTDLCSLKDKVETSFFLLDAVVHRADLANNDVKKNDCELSFQLKAIDFLFSGLEFYLEMTTLGKSALWTTNVRNDFSVFRKSIFSEGGD